MRFDSAGTPTLINGYTRRYFATPGGVLRLTVDRDLVSFNQIRTARPNYRSPAAFPDVAVVELKAGADQEDLLRQAMQLIPLRVSRFSKYCVALQNFLLPGGHRLSGL